jgi:formylglycine-generating enzyme required for sulfatase activity
MQNYAPKPSYLKSLVLLSCALSLCFASTASLSQSIEELEAEAIRQKQATQAALATYPLTINTVPANAKVSIRNIEPKYRDGMHLTSGPYQVRVEAAGYETEDKWVELGKAAKILTINLEPKPNSTTTRVSNRADAMMIGSSEITTPMPVRSASTSSQRVPFEPEMVSISAGSFTMGCVAGRDDVEGDCAEDEKPPHTVSLPAFQIGKYEVTFDEWDACERAKACPHAEDQGWGRGRRPVINVNWNDITQNYIPWLNQQTGKRYRLPTEAEWEYAGGGRVSLSLGQKD